MVHWSGPRGSASCHLPLPTVTDSGSKNRSATVRNSSRNPCKLRTSLRNICLQSAMNGGVSFIQNIGRPSALQGAELTACRISRKVVLSLPAALRLLLCLETKLLRLFASFSPARGAARPLKQPRSIDRQRALSPADSVATRCIYGQVVTTMRNGDLYEGRGTEEHGRGRCQRKVLTTIRDRDPPDRRIEFPQRCQLRCKLYRT